MLRLLSLARDFLNFFFFIYFLFLFIYIFFWKDMKKLIMITKEPDILKYIAVIMYMSFVLGPTVRIYIYLYDKNFTK